MSRMRVRFSAGLARIVVGKPGFLEEKPEDYSLTGIESLKQPYFRLLN